MIVNIKHLDDIFIFQFLILFIFFFFLFFRFSGNFFYIIENLPSGLFTDPWLVVQNQRYSCLGKIKISCYIRCFNLHAAPSY